MTDFPLEIIDPLRYPQWDELLLRQSSYSFFHSAPWARVLSESYRYRPLYFTSIDRGNIRALIPLMEIKSILTGRRGVGLPFTDYCEPILEEENCRTAMNELIQFGKKAGWDSIEIRPGNGFTPGFPSSSSYSVHTLDLTPGFDRLFKNFGDAAKRNIRKSIREGVRVHVDTTAESLASFYQLNCRTRKEHGLPPQPYSFFKKIHEHVIARNLGFVALSSFKGREIAGAVYFYSREKTIYKYGASLRSYQHLRANNLVMWEAIQLCVQKGQKSLCFGRTDLEHAGLRKFKAGWGGDEKIIDYYKYDIKKGDFVKSRSWGSGFHTAVYRCMPVSWLKILGRILYRHVG